MRRLLSVAAVAAVCLPAATAHAGQLEAGVGVVDATYRVGASAGQYATTRDNGYGDYDPHHMATKNQASYGIQSRMSVRAIVARARGGEKVALVKTSLYIPQDMLWRRAALVLESKGIGIGRENLTMTVDHSHSSPYYSSTAWGAWAFQDVFDVRFYEYMAQRIAAAVVEADRGLRPVRVSARTGHIDKLHRHSFGPARADDGTPAGYPQSDTEHEFTVVRFDDVSGAEPKPLVTLLNYSGHPEFLAGNDLLSGEYTGVLERELDRSTGAPLVFTQNAVGTAEPERSTYHDFHERLEFDHKQYGQMEWGAKKLADAVLATWQAIGSQSAGDEKLVPWFSAAPVAMEDRWFPGPLSHPYPGVSNCRTDPALSGNPGIPVVGLPDCNDDLDGSGLFQQARPVLEQTPFGPELTTDDVQALGIPIPENYSVPSAVALQETVGVHLQAFRIGDILFPVCSCEQWKDQSRNIQTRTDRVPDNEHLGYDWSAECRPADSHACRRMWHQVHNDATGWNDPEYLPYAESEPTDLAKIKGNYTHDDIDDYGGSKQSPEYASRYGYALTVPIAMANDYNGYIATYREYQRGDHYRKALTGYGPHSSDYLATRLVRMGQLLAGDSEAGAELDAEPLNAKEVANQAHANLKAAALGAVAEAAVPAYEATLPDDAGEPEALVQPKDVERFDAAFFRWRGGSNYVDGADVRVERRVDDAWQPYGDGNGGEVPVYLTYPGGTPASSQEWIWTATFEAFVGRSAWTAADGSEQRATPAGEYRFVVEGGRRAGGRTVPYTVASEPFRVEPWRGMTVEDLRLDGGRPSFRVGPGGPREGVTLKERDAGRPIAVKGFVGPIDYPDSYASELRDRFIDPTRTVVRDPAAKDDASLWEWYCLECSFRPWLDAGDAESAVVTVTRKGRVIARVAAQRSGDRWVADYVVKRGGSAEVRAGDVRDAWGNVNGEGSPVVTAPR